MTTSTDYALVESRLLLDSLSGVLLHKTGLSFDSVALGDDDDVAVGHSDVGVKYMW